MKNTIRIALTVVSFAFAQGAFAHDPAEHAREAAEAKKGADCAAMKKMDMSKMDVNDPIMKAMMTKCAQHSEGQHEHAGHSHADAPAAASTAKPDTDGSY